MGRITITAEELIGGAGTLRSVQADLSAASGAHACGDLGSPELQAALRSLTDAVHQVAAALDGAVVAAALNADAAASEAASRRRARARAGARGGAAGRRPRVVDVIRERIEQDLEPVIAALIDALVADRGVVVGQGENASVEFVPDHDARIKAARELLDRAHGKAKQQTEVTGADGGPVALDDARHGLALHKLIDEQLDQLQVLVDRAQR